MLSKQEIQRYSKQLLLPEIGMKGQEKLKNARVLMIGAGGLGCPALLYLAAAGVGNICMVDFDLVDESNLQRQLLYSMDDVGKQKATVAAAYVTKLNPHVRVTARNSKLEAGNAADIISEYDIVVDCSDNFETRYLINDTCVLLNKPFVYGGVHKFEGQLSVFNFNMVDGIPGPTYRCAFPETHPEETILSCSLNGVLGTIPGIIGTLQANEVIKMITGIGDICCGKILLINALSLSFTEIKIKKNEAVWRDFPKTQEELKNKNYPSACKEILV